MRERHEKSVREKEVGGKGTERGGTKRRVGEKGEAKGRRRKDRRVRKTAQA